MFSVWYHRCPPPILFHVHSGADAIIRQHKAACLRITALLACKDLLWIGTSAGKNTEVQNTARFKSIFIFFHTVFSLNYVDKDSKTWQEHLLFLITRLLVLFFFRRGPHTGNPSSECWNWCCNAEISLGASGICSRTHGPRSVPDIDRTPRRVWHEVSSNSSRLFW